MIQNLNFEADTFDSEYEWTEKKSIIKQDYYIIVLLMEEYDFCKFSLG